MKLSNALLARARTDSALCAALCLRDELDGSAVTLTAAHKAMHKRWQSVERSVTWSYPEGGKSANLAAHVAWRIGVNPALRIGYLSGTEAQAERHLRAVAIVMSHPDYGAVFPGVQVQRQTSNELWVSGRPQTAKDASVIAAAYDLSSLAGARLDLVAADDVVSREQANSQATRDRDYANFVALTSSRIAPGGSLHLVNTAEHADDVPHRLARLHGWRSACYPVLDAQGRSTFPARWPVARIEQRRLELGPVRFLAAMMCEASSEAALCFRADDLARALANGLATVHSEIPSGRVVIGVDPAWTSRPGADESGVVMCTVDRDGYRHLVHVEGLRVHHEALAARVIELARVNRAVVYVESNGAGALIADAIGRRVPCKPSATTRQAKEARVEALSAELASGRWILRQPLGAPGPELRKLLAELHTFSFDKHAGDRASALFMAVEGIRAVERRPVGRVLNTYTRPDGGVGITR